MSSSEKEHSRLSAILTQLELPEEMQTISWDADQDCLGKVYKSAGITVR